MVLVDPLGQHTSAVYTPKDFELNRIMTDIVRIVENRSEGNDSVTAPV